MRVVKFKAKASVSDKNLGVNQGDWVFGSYIGNSFKGPNIRRESDGYEIEIANETLCQFTGLLDSKLNEIYEKDVLDIFGDHYVVAISFSGVSADGLLIDSLAQKVDFKHFGKATIIGQSL